MMFLLTTLACAKQGLPTTMIEVGGKEITVEVADEPAERQQGLMYRDTLGADDGMLFVYPDAQERGFWMKNTKVPLSIAYADAAGRIVAIEDMTPQSLDQVPSGEPAMYALEMNRGWFDTHGVAVGATITRLPPPSAR